MSIDFLQGTQRIVNLEDLYNVLSKDIQGLKKQIELNNLILGYAFKNKLPKYVQEQIGFPSCDNEETNDNDDFPNCDQ